MIEKLFGIASAVAESNVSGTTPDPNATTAGGGILGLIFSMAPMLLIFVVFYFMLIRPQRKKDKAVKEMLNNLKSGDRICTIGGIYGTITGIKDDTVTLAVGNQNMPMVVARWAIRSVEELTIENDAEALN